VPRRLGGLRLQLALVISAVSATAIAASFLAVREGTGSALRDRIDGELREQLSEFGAAEARKPRPGDPAALERRARRFVASQSYHPRSRIFAVELRDRPVITNERRLLQREEAREPAQGEDDGEELDETGLQGAPLGLATVSGEETGQLRVLSAPIELAGRRAGTFRVADPLQPVEDAESELNAAFLAVGAAALLVSIAVALLAATVVTRPLRTMAGVASRVDAGELGRRIGLGGRRDEIGVLAHAFDHMLDRLQAAFGRQHEFVSDASHELRTPLTILRGQLELLEREEDPGERRRGIRTAIRELERMNRLVDDMLTLAAVESAEIVRPRPIDLADFAEDLKRDLPLLGDRDYEVTGVREGVLDADPERLSQVLRNLVRNAVAVTGPGDRITITVTARGSRLEVSVSDEGPGMAPGELERVFDRFHRTDSGRDRRRGGAGLGLAIARALVDAHGGRIWAESQPGRGATFRFELPGYSEPPRS
jgi:two-component system OmpR family sensor kinase